MDRHQKIIYEKDFKICFLESRGDSFQKFFEKLMGKVYPGDFIACRPWGKIGDQKNDGYLRSKRILFQVYAPNEMSVSEAISKIDEDFNGAKEHWEKYFDEWVFVHNTHDGRLSPPIIKKILDLQNQNTDFKVSHWGYEELLLEFRTLTIEDLESWFGKAFDIGIYSSLGYSELEAVLEHIERMPADNSGDIIEVSSKKIEANLLSPVVADFLKIGMQKNILVANFFSKWRDPNYEGDLAEAFKKKYIELKERRPA